MLLIAQQQQQDQLVRPRLKQQMQQTQHHRPALKLRMQQIQQVKHQRQLVTLRPVQPTQLIVHPLHLALRRAQQILQQLPLLAMTVLMIVI
jgi:hypothetical protein